MRCAAVFTVGWRLVSRLLRNPRKEKEKFVVVAVVFREIVVGRFVIE